MNILLSPLIAFGLYLGLVAALAGVGRWLAGAPQPTPLKASVYASGEAPPTRLASPGYRPFFITALFFAVLHLGVLVAGTGYLAPASGLYLLGLMVILWVLSMG